MKSLALFFAMVAPVIGRIGETREECHKRYSTGDAVDPLAGGKSYEKANMRINPSFRDDVCAWIEYSRIAKGGIISETEAAQLMQANAQGKWSLAEKKISGEFWVSESGNVTAFYSSRGGFLVITTKAESAARESEKREKEKNALEGL